MYHILLLVVVFGQEIISRFKDQKTGRWEMMSVALALSQSSMRDRQRLNETSQGIKETEDVRQEGNSFARADYCHCA